MKYVFLCLLAMAVSLLIVLMLPLSLEQAWLLYSAMVIIETITAIIAMLNEKR